LIGDSMATVWLTYAWEDNKSQDVDFAAQELEAVGLNVKLDRWNLRAGVRLWEQIEDLIQSPTESDAWVLYATQNSLGSEACKEEFAYALDRALHQRGETFPVMALFPSSIDEDLIPAGIRTRLYVSLTDPEWKERIKAAAEGVELNLSRPTVEPYELTIHEDWTVSYGIELRPRAGTWSPFMVGVPASEKAAVNPKLVYGARGHQPGMTMLIGTGSGPSNDGNWWVIVAQNEATPTQSYYLLCDSLPSKIVFGVREGKRYVVDL
jgi:hypothetical protein